MRNRQPQVCKKREDRNGMHDCRGIHALGIRPLLTVGWDEAHGWYGHTVRSACQHVMLRRLGMKIGQPMQAKGWT